MENKNWGVKELLGLSGIYWQTCTLHAAVKLEIFTRIGDSGMRSSDLARIIEADDRGVETICNALTAMGLLMKDESSYYNSNEARKYLVKTSSEYIGHMIMHHHHLVDGWARLHEAVKSGRPVRKRVASDAEERESFLMGMFTLAMGIAPRLAAEIDLSERRHLLDLGGGPGTYAIHFCLKNPDLKATVFDLPQSRPFAEGTISRFGVADRVGFQPGDYLKDPISGSYDVAWLSHILHGEGPDSCDNILKKAVAAVKPGGLIFIHEFILDDSMAAPLFPAIFSLNMLIATSEGRSYSEGQLRDMLEKAGAKKVIRLDFRGPTDSGILRANV
ncbi:MAG: methyltransferase domain-containing protein [Desulfobacteraceae bacterium]|jgi:predicted O-methyltransferase YrrM|nr:MAG: methyltransferase domain-containing protein [Desulfobacteraceae bacterium]